VLTETVYQKEKVVPGIVDGYDCYRLLLVTQKATILARTPEAEHEIVIAAETSNFASM
jgi:hypothetical protein